MLSTTVEFDPGVEVWCDSEEFEQFIHGAGISDSPEDEARLLEHACRLADGETLEGLYDEWILEARHFRRDQVIVALSRLVEVGDAISDDGRTLNAARRLVRLSPYEEIHHRAVISVLLSLGRRSEAAAQFEACRQLIEGELGGELSKETRALLG